MPSTRPPESPKPAPSLPDRAPAPGAPDPAGQSPDAPIEFTSNNDVARGNAERANAEPEPEALHAAKVPGKPDMTERRHEAAKDRET